MENSAIWFQTVPGDQTEHDSDQRDAEMGKTMLHGNGQNDVARKAADFSDRLLQRKMDFGWSSETMDVNFDVL